MTVLHVGYFPHLPVKELSFYKGGYQVKRAVNHDCLGMLSFPFLRGVSIGPQTLGTSIMDMLAGVSSL